MRSIIGILIQGTPSVNRVRSGSGSGASPFKPDRQNVNHQNQTAGVSRPIGHVRPIALRRLHAPRSSDIRPISLRIGAAAIDRGCVETQRLSEIVEQSSMWWPSRHPGEGHRCHWDAYSGAAQCIRGEILLPPPRFHTTSTHSGPWERPLSGFWQTRAGCLGRVDLCPSAIR